MLALSVNLHDSLETVLLILTIAGLLWGATKLRWKRWQGWLHRNHKDRRIIDKDFPKLMDSMDKVLAELEPNHGTSMRDAINRIEALVVKSDRTAEAWLNLDNRPMYMTDESGDMTWCNRAYVTLHGRPKEDLLGMGFMSTIAKHDLERVFKVIEDFDKRSIFTNELDYDMQMPGGSIVRVHAINHVMHDTNGTKTGVVGYLEPINKEES